jgi:alcohol dehydrogenase class IV
VVDPELTYDLPPALTVTTGLDALTQLIEPYVCLRANPITDNLCVDGIHRAARSLRRAVANGQDKSAREDMAVASLFGGLALANAGLGAVHGFAGPIGGMFPAPHGAVCAALLPHVMAANIRALRARDPENRALRRYTWVASMVTGDPEAAADAGVEWVEKLVTDLRVPKLHTYGIHAGHINDIVAKAANASSMKANPIALTSDELAEALQLAL